MLIGDEKEYSDDVYEKRVVIFLDILGFSSLVEESQDDVKKRIHLKRIITVLRKKSFIFDNSDNNSSWLSTRTSFSDSVVFSESCLHKNTGIICCLMNLSYLMFSLAGIGAFVRGGIAIGDVYHDNRMLFGPAMKEAYRLESKEAVYPRIVMKKETFETEMTEPFIRDAFIDDGSLVYFDVLSQPHCINTVYGDEYNERKLVETIRRNIQDALVTYKGNERIYEKYAWLRDYWNRTVKNGITASEVHLQRFSHLYDGLEI